jgi:DNA-binding XRE family transcriptional regulator
MPSMSTDNPASRLAAALEGQDDPEAVPRTQSALARRLGVSTTAVNAWTRGSARPRLDYAVELERLYGIPVAAWARSRESRRV